ncbi:unnamed protein product [Prunus brigantina]
MDTLLYDVANLAAWCSGPRGCARTRDVLLLDAVCLCAGVPARSTVRRDGDGVWVEDVQMMRLFGVGLLIKQLWPREELISAAEKDLPDGLKISAWWSLIGASG